MTADMNILKLTTQLEEAGGLGLLAAGLLTPFFVLESNEKGAFSGTNTGFVWSKTMGGGLRDSELPFLIGKLKIKGAILSATVGVELTNGSPSHINIMISLGEGGNPVTVLEIDPKIAVLATKITDPLDPSPPSDRKVIGYKDAGLPLEIGLPLASLEFTFHLDLHEGDIRSSMVLHESLGDFLSSQIGIFELDLNDVIVFPKLGDVGLYINKLFIDFTESAATGFTQMFPEVYDPSWKGFGAKEATLLYPINTKENEEEFIYSSVLGFMYGIDHGFSGKFNIAYVSNDVSKTIGKVSGEVEIRNNCFLKSSLAVDINFKKIIGAAETDANETDTSNISSEDQDFLNAMKELRGDVDRPPVPPLPQASYVRCQATLVNHKLAEEEVFGIELMMTDVSVLGNKSSDGVGIDIEGSYAQAFFITSVFTAGVFILKDGWEKDDGFLKFAGGLLLLLSAAECVLTSGAGNSAVLPTLDKVSLTQLGMRYIHIQPTQGDTKKVFEAVAGLKFKFKLNGGLIDFIEWIANKTGIVGAFNAGEIFGYDLSSLDLGGNIEVALNNININFTGNELPEHIGRLFDRKNTTIKALKLPELRFNSQENPGGSVVVPKVKPIIKNREGGETWYGLGIFMSPQTGPSASLDFPAGGIVLYLRPDFDIEFVAQLAEDPGITYMIPNVLLAKGTFDINRPIPAFSGTQNRLAVEVGAWSALPPLTDTNAKAKAKRKKELLKVSNYKYQFSGEVVWGDAIPTVGPQDKYDFYFVQIGYEGKSPLFSLGALGFYGFDVIYGMNIAPGYPSGKVNALGIADWITTSPDPKAPFDNIRDWPTTPSTATWHPDIYWDEENQEFKRKHVAGLIVHAGSAGDGGDTFDIKALVLMGFREFWIAVAAQTKIKPINLDALAIFAYDSGDWLFRLVAKFKKNSDGSFMLAQFPVEFGSSSDPDKGWFYFGHYDKKYGGPAIVDIFKRFKIKFFLVYASEGLENFGLMPFETIFKPNIPGPAWGAGGLFQIGPKKYGPSFLSLKLFAALGFNLAYKHNPTFFYGELYAGGYMELKVVIIKFKLELLARLQGMAIEDDDRWMGEISIKLSLPWPLSDVEERFDFIISQSPNFVPIPGAPFAVTASALARLETRSYELLQETVPEIPIDSIVGISLGRPVAEIIHPELDDPNGTTLYVNDVDPSNAGEEMMETDYQGIKYVVQYEHVISDLRVAHRPIGGGEETVVEMLLASWNLPVFGSDGALLDGQHKNQVLYLNGLMPPELQFNTEGIDNFDSWENSITEVHPCQLGGSVCIMDVSPIPNVGNNTVPELRFDTFLGEIIVNGLSIEDGEADLPLLLVDNIKSLGWSSSAPRRITLPYTTWIETVFASRVQLSLGILVTEELSFEDFDGILSHFRISVGIDLRGRLAAERLRFNIQLTPDEQSPCGFYVTLENRNSTDDQIMVELTDAPCLDSELPGCQLSITTVNEIELIQKIHITGYNILLNPGIDWSTMGDSVNGLLNRLIDSELLLAEFCIERAQLNPGSWEVIVEDGDSNEPTSIEEAINNLLNKNLFEPNREYTIDYKISTFAKTFTVDEDGGLDNENKASTVEISTTEIDSGIETVVFRTETAPTQNVTKYLGFTFPSGRIQPVYAASAVPLISLKYQGIIQNIFQKHYGEEVLNPQMVDINGDVILPQIVSVVDLFSSPADQSLEDMLATCVPQAETIANLKLLIWAGALLKDMSYSLQMVDSSDPNELKTPVNISFKTSRYESFGEHMAAIANLVMNGRLEAVANSSSVSTDIENFIKLMTHFDGPAYSFDGAIERFYRDILSLDGGSIGNTNNEDSLTFLVGIDPDDSSETGVLIWGVVIELTEPLLSKAGIALNVEDSYSLWLDVGLNKTTDGYLILRDLVASRMIILNTVDGLTFTPFTDDINLGVVFNSEFAVRQELETYVELAYPNKEELEQTAEVERAIAEMKQIPEVDEAFVVSSQTLIIPLPQDS